MFFVISQFFNVFQRALGIIALNDLLIHVFNKQSPCMCIDKAVIFLGENAGLQTFLQIIHPAASNKLFFSTGIAPFKSIHHIDVRIFHLFDRLFLAHRQVEKENPDGTLSKQVR